MWPASPKWPWRPASCTGTNPMQTPWGDFHVCDAHVHFFSPAFFASLAAESGQPPLEMEEIGRILDWHIDRKSTRLNSSHLVISYGGFCVAKYEIFIYCALGRTQYCDVQAEKHTPSHS